MSTSAGGMAGSRSRVPVVGGGRVLRSGANEAVLALCALVFLCAYTVEVVGEPRGGLLVTVEVVLWTTWAIFAVDWAVAFLRDGDKRGHVWEHLLGLVVVVLPVFAPLRVLRLISLIVFLQRLVMRSSLRVTVLWYAVSSSALVVYVCGLGVLQLERHAPGASITSLSLALWWATATVTTVGYGDMTPVTAGGRMIAVVLMISGIALLGVVTATLASWLVDRVAEENERAESDEQQQLRALAAEIAALRAELAREGRIPPASE